VSAAWHHAGLRNQLDIRQRSPTEPDEARRVKPLLQILQPMIDGVRTRTSRRLMIGVPPAALP
jgi:hypothetical protein